ncbi:hypothetical protein MASR1M12_00850 [Erysipelotrichia bacterium]
MKKQLLVCMKCGQICAPRRHLPHRCRICGAKEPWTFAEDESEAISIKKTVIQEADRENRKRI